MGIDISDTFGYSSPIRNTKARNCEEMSKCKSCDREMHARGFCKKHYEFARTNRLIDIIQQQATPGMSGKERLAMHSRQSLDGDCLLWVGHLDIGGYGRVSYMGKDQAAHRVAWEIANGAPAGDLKVLHKCDVRNCINPKHLFLGTDADNVADKCAKGRQAKGEKNGKAKLTNQEVMNIRGDNRPSSHIAKDYGVSAETIRGIRRGRCWKETKCLP